MLAGTGGIRLRQWLGMRCAGEPTVLPLGREVNEAPKISTGLSTTVLRAGPLEYNSCGRRFLAPSASNLFHQYRRSVWSPAVPPTGLSLLLGRQLRQRETTTRADSLGNIHHAPVGNEYGPFCSGIDCARNRFLGSQPY